MERETRSQSHGLSSLAHITIIIDVVVKFYITLDPHCVHLFVYVYRINYNYAMCLWVLAYVMSASAIYVALCHKRYWPGFLAILLGCLMTDRLLIYMSLELCKFPVAYIASLHPERRRELWRVASLSITGRNLNSSPQQALQTTTHRMNNTSVIPTPHA
jgi:hypothetical protein